MKEIIITEKEAGQRIDKLIRKTLSEAPLSFIYRLFRLKDIKVNGKRVDISYQVLKDDKVTIYITDKQLQDFVKPRMMANNYNKLNIIYEDENILVINKPSGILVHGDYEEKRITLANQVLGYLASKNEFDPAIASFIPSPAHRLDRNTSGLVFFGKNIESLQCLMELFKNKDALDKEYYALLDGKVLEEGHIDLPLIKDEKNNEVRVGSIKNGAKEAHTSYRLLAFKDGYSLVKAKLITGRTHQLRVHFQAIGHPIVGDRKYGNIKTNREFKLKYAYDHQFLHAYRILLKNVNGKLNYLSNHIFKAEFPKKEKEIIGLLYGNDLSF